MDLKTKWQKFRRWQRISGEYDLYMFLAGLWIGNLLTCTVLLILFHLT